jgi:hypothetical protein
MCVVDWEDRGHLCGALAQKDTLAYPVPLLTASTDVAPLTLTQV